MVLKKQMFALTIAACIETEILVREGRLHRCNDRKNQGSKKSERKNWKKQHYMVNILDSFLKKKKKEEGRKALL